MKAMVLAAGLGTRLRPITHWIPKAMMPVFGTPIIELNLRQLRDQGIRDVVINLHHLPAQIVRHLGDGSSLGLRITYSFEPRILGSAGGIKKMEDHLQDGPFLILNADTYRIMDIEALCRHHQESGAILTLLLRENPALKEQEAVLIDERGGVAGFLDLYRRPNGGPFAPADFLGVQVMEPEVLRRIPSAQPWDLRSVYAELLSSGGSVIGHLQGDYWMDLGTLDRYRQLHMDALDGKCPVEIPGRAQEPGVWIGEGAWIDPDVRIHAPVSIGPHCRLHGRARIGPYAVLGRACTVERGARVARSILLDGVRIHELDAVEECLVSRAFHRSLSSHTWGER